MGNDTREFDPLTDYRDLLSLLRDETDLNVWTTRSSPAINGSNCSMEPRNRALQERTFDRSSVPRSIASIGRDHKKAEAGARPPASRRFLIGTLGTLENIKIARIGPAHSYDRYEQDPIPWNAI